MATTARHTIARNHSEYDHCITLEHGKTHTLHIPAVDNDGDKTKCQLSSYVEAGAFQFLVNNLTAAKIVEMNEKEDCVLTINLNNTRFSVGNTFVLPITVKDFSRKFIVTVMGHPAYETPIGRVTALANNKIQLSKKRWITCATDSNATSFRRSNGSVHINGMVSCKQ
uniref:Uncharacterized protein n=1 Tax=Magallana gigas TaxID=29159 RepID=K1PK29_MAGGI